MALLDSLKGRKGLVFAAGGVAVVGGLIWWRHRQAAATAASSSTDTMGTGVQMVTDPDGNQCEAVDPTSGYCPGTPGDVQYQQQLSGAGYGGDLGGYGYGGLGGGQPCTTANGEPGITDQYGNCQAISGSGGGSTGGLTTNQEWAQAAEAQIGETSAIQVAIGKYLSGQALTSAQAQIVDRAIGAEGQPPQKGIGGYPPNVRLRKGGGDGQGKTGWYWHSLQHYFTNDGRRASRPSGEVTIGGRQYFWHADKKDFTTGTPPKKANPPSGEVT